MLFGSSPFGKAADAVGKSDFFMPAALYFVNKYVIILLREQEFL